MTSNLKGLGVVFFLLEKPFPVRASNCHVGRIMRLAVWCYVSALLFNEAYG